MSQRPRKARSPKFAALGERGRVTGTIIQAAPLNDDGVEDPEAFFRSPPASNKQTPSQPVDARRAARPDKTADLGYVGRKTGVPIKGAPRNSQGVEDVDAFFKSPTEPSHTAKSNKHARAPVSEASSPIQRTFQRSNTPSDFHQSSDLEEAPLDVDDESREDSFDAPPHASTSRISALAKSDSEDEGFPDIVLPKMKTTEKAAPPRTNGKAREISPPAAHKDPFAANDYSTMHDDLPGEMDYALGDATLPDDKEAGTELQEPKSSKKKGRPPKKSKANGAPAKATQAKSAPDSQPTKAKAAPSKKRKLESEEPEGVRRSSRASIKPLEYWRCERILYERRKSGPQPHYGMKDVVRIPKEEPPQRPAKRHKRAGSRLKTIEEDEGETYAGWDDTTDPEGIVWDYALQAEVKRRIAFTSAMVKTKPATSKNGKPGTYRFQKIFTDGDFMAGGVLELPVNGVKPLKPARDNTYMIFCSKGVVRVLVYRTTFTIARGGYFLVPRGNSYEVENIGNDEAQLVFMQAREIRMAEQLEGDE